MWIRDSRARPDARWRRLVIWSVVTGIGLCLLCEPTRAQPGELLAPEQRRQKAQELVNQATALHRQLLFARAAEMYRQALVYWEDADAQTGEGNGVFRRKERGDMDEAWISIVVGHKPG